MTISAAAVIHPIHGKSIRLEKGDLTGVPVDAIVLYAREDLQLGSGFGSAVTARGGIAIQSELKRIWHIGMGEAVVTSAGTLPSENIIHACGPKFQEADVEGKLRKCLQASLQAAAAKGFKTVAFPPMGAGFYGVPLELCARVMVEVIGGFLSQSSSLEEVLLCVIDDRELRVFEAGLRGRLAAA
jgi:O-acetyl-ADP-ribose deacetylase (regulator of RNase III)